jgi:cysteine dioxygenase
METNNSCPEEFSLVPPKNLDELVKELHKVFSYDRVNVDYVKALLSSYKSTPKDWKKFAKFDQHRYTRNLVDEGNGKFNLMVLCWNESQGSSIHDHADAHCFVKVLDGQLMETMFAWPEDSEEETEMRQTDVNTYKKEGVTYINDSIGLHRMENPSHTDKAITMHLYSPPFSSCKIFDQRTGHKNEVQVTFWSKYGSRTPFEVPCSAVYTPENN